MSFDFARRISGPRAPERAIFALFSSWVARLVMHPTALHWTSTFGDIICRIRGASPPRATIKTLLSATLVSELYEGWRDEPFTARLPRAALAARWTSISGLCSKKRMGSRVSRSTSRTSVEHVRRRNMSWRWHTSLSDFSKGQASAALEVDVIGIDEGTQSSKGLSGEEICFGALQTIISVENRGLREHTFSR